MRPTPAPDINRLRAAAAGLLRLASIALLTLGAYLFLKRLVFASLSGQPVWEMLFQTWDGIGETHSGSRGVALIAVGAALGLASGRLALWIVPVVSRGCPACGYALAGEARCPECGLPSPNPRPGDGQEQA